GVLILRNDGGGSPARDRWTSSVIPLNVPQTLEIRFKYNSITTQPTPNPPYDSNAILEVRFNGVTQSVAGADDTYPHGIDQSNGLATLTSVILRGPASTAGLLMSVHRCVLGVPVEISSV